MFKKVINYKGFWKSVLLLSICYAIVMYFLNWGLTGRWAEILEAKLSVLVVFFIGSFLIGFIFAYAKYWKKLKEMEARK